MTPDHASLILESLSAGCALDAALKAACVTRDDFRAYCGANRDFERSCDAAIAAAKKEAFARLAKMSAEIEGERKREEAKPKAAKPAPVVTYEDDEPEGGSLDLARIAVEASALAPGPFGFFLWVDARRIVAGFPPISNWWRYSIGEFYASGKPWGWWEVGRGGGKALALDTPIATSRGWTTMGAIKPGDVVFDETGEPCNVIACSEVQTERECFEVEFSDGSKIVADAEHLWKTSTRTERSRAYRQHPDVKARERATAKGNAAGDRLCAARMEGVEPPGSVRTTRQIASTLTVHAKGERNHAVPVAGPLVMPYVGLPLDPYVLGVWLGDGHSDGCRITSADPEIIDAIREAGYPATAGAGKYGWNVRGLREKVRAMGMLNNKHIPAMYLRASIPQRLELLRGLMDTDGTCAKDGKCNFDTTNERLMRGVSELLASLGIKCRPAQRMARLNGRDICPSWRFTFCTNLSVFKLGRKAKRQRPVQRCALRRFIVAVRQVPSVPVRCIVVDSPTHMFLAGREMIPTHNSTTLECVAGTDSFFGARKVPPGQTWTWPFISVGPDDANRRINGIAAVYRAIGLPIVGDEADGKKIKRGDGVNIVRAPRGALELCDARGNEIALASIAGTIGNISGPSTIGLTIDEAAKLHDRSTNANPLTEIVASGSQTSRARAGWRAIVCSSAWERHGLHFEVIDAGERGEEGESNYIARIGDAFMEETLRGFYDVAAWEEARGDREAARIIRAHAATLTPRSPHIPTFTANPTLGNPEAVPWAGAALASRKLVEVLPEKALDGLPRVMFWLRENGSVALDRGRGGATLTLEDAQHIAAQNRALKEAWRPPRKQSEDGMFDYGPADDAGPVRWRGL